MRSSWPSASARRSSTALRVRATWPTAPPSSDSRPPSSPSEKSTLATARSSRARESRRVSSALLPPVTLAAWSTTRRCTSSASSEPDTASAARFRRSSSRARRASVSSREAPSMAIAVRSVTTSTLRRSSAPSGAEGSSDASRITPSGRPMAVRMRHAITDAARNERQTSVARSSPSVSISSASRSGAASQASTRGSSSGRPRPSAASTRPGRPWSRARVPAGCSASSSSGIANHPAARVICPCSSSTVTNATPSTRRSARMSSTSRADARSVQPLGSRLWEGVGRMPEDKGVRAFVPSPASPHCRGKKGSAPGIFHRRFVQAPATATAPKPIR